MAIPVLIRLFATLPETPGPWPPLDVEVTSGGLRISHSTEEEKPEEEGALASICARGASDVQGSVDVEHTLVRVRYLGWSMDNNV